MNIRRQSAPAVEHGASRGDNSTGSIVTGSFRRRNSRVRASAMCRRRRASDLARDFWCPETECRRRYEAWRSLQHHLRADHGMPMRLREYKSIRHARGQDLMVDSRGLPIIAHSPTGSSDHHDSGDNSGNDNEFSKTPNATMATSLPAHAGSGGRSSLLASFGDSVDFEEDDEDDIMGQGDANDVSSIFPAVLSESDESMEYYPSQQPGILLRQQQQLHPQQLGIPLSSHQESGIVRMGQQNSRHTSSVDDPNISLGDVVEFPDLWQSLSADLSRSFIRSPDHQVLLRGSVTATQQPYLGNNMGRGQNPVAAYSQQPSFAVQTGPAVATPMSDLWSFLAGPYPEPLEDISSLLPV